MERYSFIPVGRHTLILVLELPTLCAACKDADSAVNRTSSLLSTTAYQLSVRPTCSHVRLRALSIIQRFPILVDRRQPMDYTITQ